MDVNDSLMRALKQIMEMFGIREEEVFEQNELPAPKRTCNIPFLGYIIVYNRCVKR